MQLYNVQKEEALRITRNKRKVLVLQFLTSLYVSHIYVQYKPSTYVIKVYITMYTLYIYL